MALQNFTPPSGGDGDQWAPKDNHGKPVIVKVRERRHGIITSAVPEGTDALLVDLVDLTTGQVLRDVLWFGGAQVDGLAPHIGQDPLVIKFGTRTSKIGRPYTAPEPVSPEEFAYAQQWLSTYGDPFVSSLSSLPPKNPEPAAPVLPTLPPIGGAPATLPAQALQRQQAAYQPAPGHTYTQLPPEPPAPALPPLTPPAPAPVAAQPNPALAPVPATVYAAMMNAGMDVSGFTPQG